jgi:hypothetical protein
MNGKDGGLYSGDSAKTFRRCARLRELESKTKKLPKNNEPTEGIDVADSVDRSRLQDVGCTANPVAGGFRDLFRASNTSAKRVSNVYVWLKGFYCNPIAP